LNNKYSIHNLTYTASIGKFNLHVTLHRDKYLIIKPTRFANFSNLFLGWNSTCFGEFLCPSSGVFHWKQQWCMS